MRFNILRNDITQLKAAADITAYFQKKASESQDSYHTLMAGLLYGALTSYEKREEYFNYVSLVTRDSYQLFVELLENVHIHFDEIIIAGL